MFCEQKVKAPAGRIVLRGRRQGSALHPRLRGGRQRG